MHESSESSVSSQNISILAQPPTCTSDKLPSQEEDSSTSSSHLTKRISKNAPSVNKTDDVSQSQDDRVVPDASTEENPADTTADQEINTHDLSEVYFSRGCKGMRRCATFPPTEGDTTVPKSVLHGKNPISEQPTYERSKSLPTHLKSALKGSRAQQPGASPRSADLHVKWAPDVYDPPVTSQSHTAQSHTGRKGSGGGSSSKGKKRGKKKDKRKNKGNTLSHSGGVISERKSADQSGRKSACDTTSTSDSPDKTINLNSDVEFSSQDMKCGSEFMREGLPKSLFSTAEASLIKP